MMGDRLMADYPYPSEIARAIHDGAFGERTYREEEWLARTVVDDLRELGWTVAAWSGDAAAVYGEMLASPCGQRVVIIAAYAEPEAWVEIAVFRRSAAG